MAALPFSRKIKNIEYDPESQTLVIEFTGRIVKKYSGVPQEAYNELIHSNDPNAFYQEKINGFYIVQ